jgi:hypothetical protein
VLGNDYEGDDDGEYQHFRAGPEMAAAKPAVDFTRKSRKKTAKKR